MRELIGGLYGQSAIRSEAYTRYVVCKEMGWDWHTYMAQPPFFIEEILLIMNQEAQKEKKDAKDLERKSKVRK